MPKAVRPELWKGTPTGLSPLPHETVSILLSTDRKDLERVLVKGLVSKTNIKKGTFLFDGSNTHFLGLEHFLKSSGSGKAARSLGIRIADPHGEVINNLFEKDFLRTTEFEAERQQKLRAVNERLAYRAVVADDAADAAEAEAEDQKITKKEQIELEIDVAEYLNENLKYYVAYGIGSDSRFWAGPFVVQIQGANYTFTDRGFPILQLNFVPDIVFDVTLSVANRGNFYVDPQANGPVRVRASTRTKIGSVKKSKKKGKDTKGKELITILSITAAISECHRKWAKSMGIVNFIHIVPNLLLDIKEFSTSGKAKISTEFIKALTEELEKLGFSIYNTPSEGKKKGKVERDEEEYSIFIDILDKYREVDHTIGPYARFMKPFTDFYTRLGEKHKMDLDFDLFMESNVEIMKMLKTLSPNKYGHAIFTYDSPLYVLAERSIYAREMYNGGLTVLLEPQTALSNEYKEAVGAYLYQKVTNRNLPSIYSEKNKNIHRSNPYAQLSNPTGGPFGLGQFFQSLTSLTQTGDAPPVPVFEANTPNSNIVSYSLDQSVAALGALKIASGYRGDSNLKKTMRKTAVEELTKLATSYPGADFLSQAGKGYDFSSLADNLVDSFYSTNSEGYVFPKRTGDPDDEDQANAEPESTAPMLRRYLKFFWDTTRWGGTRGTIKTVPMFHLSDNALISQLCVLNIFKNPIVGGRHKEDLYNTTYSGLYWIIGFRHVINAGEAYSEFTVLKNTIPLKGSADKKDNFDLYEGWEPDPDDVAR